MCDVHFYNFIPECSAVVWVVIHSPVTTETGTACFFLVIHPVEDPRTVVGLKNLAHEGDLHGLCAVEMGLRWDNPILRTLLDNVSGEFAVAVGEDDVATRVEAVWGDDEYLVGVGQLEVDTKTFNRVDSVNDSAIIDPEFFDLEVTITTAEGVYSYPRGPTKRKKKELTIWEVFEKRDLRVDFGGTTLQLRIVVSALQVFYVNAEAVWNGGLGEFFRMLYAVVYDSFPGVKPIFVHVKSSQSILYPFPNFPAFPFISLNFDCDSFRYYVRRRNIWLLSEPRVRRTELAARLLGINGRDLKIPRLDNPITPWSVNTSDINGKLLDEESDSLITVSGTHTIMILDFRPCFLNILTILVIEELEEAWVHLPEDLKNYLNYLVNECISAGLQFSKALEGNWVYITGQEMCLLVEGHHDSDEVRTAAKR